jgi:hypothetical protein
MLPYRNYTRGDVTVMTCEEPPAIDALVRWSRLLGQFGGEVKLLPDVIIPPVGIVAQIL